jgi:hypothetical protein
MRLPLPFFLLLTPLVAGCASKGPKHVSAREFERRFTDSQTVAMKHFRYACETNGCVYIVRVTWTECWAYSKLRLETLYTETNRLPVEFLQDVREHPVEPSRPPVHWVGKPGAEPDGAANRSQPVRSETNQTSGAAGSGR